MTKVVRVPYGTRPPEVGGCIQITYEGFKITTFPSDKVAPVSYDSGIETEEYAIWRAEEQAAQGGIDIIQVVEKRKPD